MSSDLLDNSRAARSAADRVLTRLKTHGPQSAAAIGQALGFTSEAARQQLLRLAAEGLAESAAESGGVGRPTQIWSLTAGGHGRFPDTHSVLAVKLLDTLRQQFGEQGLERLIDARDSETRRSYAALLASDTTLAQRVERLAQARSAEGYMCEWRREDNGDFLLIENHCPICAAAATCQSLCRAELRLFREVLGPEVRIDRVEHIQAGGRRCTYRISAA